MIFYTHARLKALPLVPVIFPTMRGAAYGNSYSENPIFCLILELLCRGMIHVDHHGVQWSLHIGYTHRTPMFSATHFSMNLLGTTLQQVARVRSFNHATGRRSFQLHSSRFSTSAPHLAKLSSLPSSCTKLNKYHTSSVMAFLPSADVSTSWHWCWVLESPMAMRNSCQAWHTNGKSGDSAETVWVGSTFGGFGGLVFVPMTSHTLIWTTLWLCQNSYWKWP